MRKHMVCANYDNKEWLSLEFFRSMPAAHALFPRAYKNWHYRLFPPQVHLVIRFPRSSRPCTDCYAGIEQAVEDVFGNAEICPFADYEDDRVWLVEADFPDRDRLFNRLDPRIDRLSHEIMAVLNRCQGNNHFPYH